MKLNKEQLIQEVLSLQDSTAQLRELVSIIEKTNRRLENLERQQNLNNQYIRRDTVEIVGIPKTVKH